MARRKSLISLFWVLLLATFWSCQGPGTEIQSAHRQVMDIHDEVMPKQSEISAAQLTIKKWIQSQDSTFTVPVEMSSVLTQLADAEEAMWSWMNNYTKPKSDEDPSSAMRYLKNEEEAISTVRNQMLTSLEAYEKVKKKYSL